jgi:Flp pilus assembly protein TadG
VKRKGQSIVEFALLVPVLVLILIAIIEFGLLFNAYFVIQTSARDAARQLSIGASDADIQTLVVNQAVGLDVAQLTTTIDPAQGSRTRGSDVTVTIVYGHSVITPLLSIFTGQIIDLEAKVVMRVE